jgi:hypothetical protein
MWGVVWAKHMSILVWKIEEDWMQENLGGVWLNYESRTEFINRSHKRKKKAKLPAVLNLYNKGGEKKTRKSACPAGKSWHKSCLI